MKYPIEIPANSFLESYESDEYDHVAPASKITVGWKNLDTGEVITIVYRNDIHEYTPRILFTIMRDQMDAHNLGPDECAARLREMAEERA
jgi:hypothetical protein